MRWFLIAIVAMLALPVLAYDEHEREDIVLVEMTNAPLHFIRCLPGYVKKGFITGQQMREAVEAWNASGGRVERVRFQTGALGINHWYKKDGTIVRLPNYRVPERYFLRGRLISEGCRWAWKIGPLYCFEGCTNLWIPVEQRHVSPPPTVEVSPIPTEAPAYVPPPCPEPTPCPPTARLNLQPIVGQEIPCVTPCYQPQPCYPQQLPLVDFQRSVYLPSPLSGWQERQGPGIGIGIGWEKNPCPPKSPYCPPGGGNPDPPPGGAWNVGGSSYQFSPGNPSGYIPGGCPLPPALNKGMMIPVPDHPGYGIGLPQIGSPVDPINRN
jgi:hypothetical protein